MLHQMGEPVWAATAAAGLPVALHAHPSAGSRQLGVGVQGVEPRNQNLMRFVLEEAGVGWVPYMFWRFDQEWDLGGGEPFVRVFQRDFSLPANPSEFIKHQIFLTFEVEGDRGFRRLP